MLHLSLLVSTPVLLGLDGATGVASDPPWGWVFWLCVPIATLFAAEQATLPARLRRPVTVVGFLV